MAITPPSAISEELLKDQHDFLYLYEISLASGSTIRFSSQAVTWPVGGNAYLGQVIEGGEVVERLRFHIPELKLQLQNVDEYWKQWIEPTDQLTGRPLVKRLIVRDLTTGAWKSDSQITFDGFVERARKITERTFTLDALGKLAGLGTRVPRRRTSLFCNARFADGVDCMYVKSADADGAGSGATVTVKNFGADIFDRLEVGQEIKIGTSGVRTITDVRDSPPEIDLNNSTSWSDNDAIVYQKCSRQFGTEGGCKPREERYHFLGFNGVDAIARAGALSDLGAAGGAVVTRPNHPLVVAVRNSDEPEPTANTRTAVPLAYGRVFTSGMLVEATVTKWSGQDQKKSLELKWYLLGEGEFASIERFYLDGEKGKTKLDDAGKKVQGIFVRLGGLGIDATESAYASEVLPQNRDQTKFSKTKNTYSRSCVVLTIQTRGDEAGGQFMFDAKAREVQIYDSLGVPQGVQWSDSPVWQILDVLLTPRFGMGKSIAASEIDYAVADATATECATVIDGAKTTIRANNGGPSSDKVHFVEDSLGFSRGMTLLVDGNPAGEIVDVPSRKKIETDTSLLSTVGEVVQARIPRFSSNGVLTSGERGGKAIVAILRAFNGYITYDGSKIQVRIEKAEGASSAHFRDTGYAQGYGIAEGSFEWLTEQRDLETNAYAARFRNQSTDLGEDEAIAVDWDHVADNDYAEKTFDLPFVHNQHQAYRLAKRKLDKIRLLGTGAKFIAQPIAVFSQPGDVIEVSHATAGWSGAFKRITEKKIIGLGKPTESFVELTVEDYDAAVYGDAGDPLPFAPDEDEPALVLTVESDENSRVILSWEFDDALGLARGVAYSIYKSTTASIDPTRDLLVARTGAEAYVYSVPPDEVGVTLYFVVVAHTTRRSRIAIVSNEVNVTPSAATSFDPTAGGGPFYNLLWGGDFDGEMEDRDGDDYAEYHPNWDLTEPTSGGETEVLPTAHVAGNWNNPTNAYDSGAGYEDTYADVDLVNPPQYQTEVIDFTFAAGTKTGRFEATVQHIGRWNQGAVDFLMSIDGGSNFTLIGGGNSNKGKFTVATGQYNALDMSQAVLRVQGIGNTGNGRVHEMRAFHVCFKESTLVAPWAKIANSILTLHGDGTNAAIARRPFPGPTPDAGLQVVTEGDELLIWLQFRAPSAVTVDPTVHLVDENTGDEWLLATLPAAEIPVGTGPSDWKFRVFRWVSPSTAIAGNLYFEIRSKQNSAIEFPNAGVYPGAEVIPVRWWPHVDELRGSRHGDRSVGRPLGFSPGPWSAFSTGRGSSVTGGTR